MNYRELQNYVEAPKRPLKLTEVKRGRFIGVYNNNVRKYRILVLYDRNLKIYSIKYIGVIHREKNEFVYKTEYSFMQALYKDFQVKWKRKQESFEDIDMTLDLK